MIEKTPGQGVFILAGYPQHTALKDFLIISCLNNMPGFIVMKEEYDLKN